MAQGDHRTYKVETGIKSYGGDISSVNLQLFEISPRALILIRQLTNFTVSSKRNTGHLGLLWCQGRAGMFKYFPRMFGNFVQRLKA